MTEQPEIRLDLASHNDEPVGFDELGRGAQLLAAYRAITSFKPPIVVGVYGDWGEGKTSFMRTLQALLTKETRDKYAALEKKRGIDDANGLTARAERVLKEGELDCDELLTVWFSPWQHQFEDEPIMPLLDAIRLQHQDRWSRMKAKLKGLVENPKFRIIAKASLGVAKLAGPGWFSALSRQIGDEAARIMDSFAEFSNEFEKCMQELTANNGQRIVIFVDDLDRCEAKYAVKILEALKLHLLNRHCVFVLGCADKRVRAALTKHLELSDTQANEYLDKIIQVPLHLPRARKDDLARLLKAIKYKELADNEQCFELLRAFAGLDPNPRRLKRFLHWYEVEKSMIEFVPGLSETNARPFLAKENEPLLLKIKMLQFLQPRRFFSPEDFIKVDTGKHESDEERESKRPEKGLGEPKEAHTSTAKDDPSKPEVPSSIADHHKRVLRTKPFVGPAIENDPELQNGLLLLLTLSTEHEEAHGIAEERRVVASQENWEESARIIEEAIRAETGKDSGQLSAKDYLAVKVLDLSKSSVSDISPLAALPNLRALGLSNTRVTDLRPLGNLATLKELHISDTDVTDVKPLAGLTNLEILFLNNTQVANVKPLARLTNLRILDLAHTQVTDVGPLVGLTNLRNLDLAHTQVTKVMSLAALVQLRNLDLKGTRVTNLTPLENIKGLKIVMRDGGVKEILP